MVFDSIWEVWPLKGYFNSKNSRKHAKSTSRCSSAKNSHEPLIQILGPWESNMVALQSILIWEKPGRSVVAVVVANLIYWSLAYSEVRFFFGLSMLGLAAFLHHQWVYSIWPEISVPQPQVDQEEWTPVHPSVLSAPEVSRYLENMWKYIQKQQMRLIQLRRRQPGLFCLVMVTILCFLWLVGYIFSGVLILYSLLMTVMCGPGFIIHFVPKSTFKKLERISSFLFGQSSETSENSENDLAEFLPEEGSAEVQSALSIPLTSVERPEKETPEGTKVLQPKGRDNAKGRRGRTRKEVSAEAGLPFASGLSENDFPSLEESMDFVEESDLALPEIIPEGREHPKSSNPEAGEMTFVSSHFGDSSDDEDDFASGLSFRRTATPTVVDSRGAPFEDSESSPQILPLNPATSAVVSHLMGSMTAETTTTLLSSLGQQLASAIGVTSLPQGPQLAASPPLHQDPISKMSISESSIEEEFELISDDDLQ